MKKTKKELHEQIVSRMLWNKKRDKILWITIIFVLIGVLLWKYDRLFIDLFTSIKIYLIAIGFGFCLGMMISYFIKIDVSKEKQKINQRIRRYLAKIDQLTKGIINETKNLTPEEIHKIKKIKRLENKVSKLEVEYLLFEVRLQIIGGIIPVIPGFFYKKEELDFEQIKYIR